MDLARQCGCVVIYCKTHSSSPKIKLTGQGAPLRYIEGLYCGSNCGPRDRGLQPPKIYPIQPCRSNMSTTVEWNISCSKSRRAASYLPGSSASWDQCWPAHEPTPWWSDEQLYDQNYHPQNSCCFRLPPHRSASHSHRWVADNLKDSLVEWLEARKNGNWWRRYPTKQYSTRHQRWLDPVEIRRSRVWSTSPAKDPWKPYHLPLTSPASLLWNSRALRFRRGSVGHRPSGGRYHARPLPSAWGHLEHDLGL